MRGIYIFPNLFTAANLAFGFWAIALLMTDDPSQVAKAAWLILFANVFDTMDGRVARWTKTQSRFGVEFDSLADLVAFGVAPACLMLEVSLRHFGRLGFLAALLYVTCGALRLARFNVMANAPSSPSYFLGCPIPAVSTFLASMVLYDLSNTGVMFSDRAYLVMTAVCAVLMVSNLPYPSAKKSESGRLVAKIVLLSLVLVAMLTYKQDFIFLVAASYLASGIVWKLGRSLARLGGLLHRRNKDVPAKQAGH